MRASAPLSRQTAPLIAVAVGAALSVALYLGLGEVFLVLIISLVIGSIVLLSPRFGLYLAIVLMPLEGAGRLVGDLSTITWAKLALFVTVFGLLGVRMLRKEALLLPRGAWLLYIVFACAVVGTAVNFNLVGSGLWGIVAFMGQALIIVIIYNLVEDIWIFENTLVAIVIGSIPVTLVAVLDFSFNTSVLGTAEHFLYASAASGVIRVTSTFSDSNALGTYMVFALAVTFGVFMLQRFMRWRGALMLLIGAQFFALVVTFSRGAFLALVVVTVLFLVWQRGLGRRVVSAAALALGAFFLSSASLLVILGERFAVGGTLALDSSRLVIYGAGLDLIWRSPVFGFGPDNVPNVLGTVFGAPVSAHSLFLEVVLGVGLLGAAAMASFAVIQLVSAVRLRRTPLAVYARTAVLALTGVLVSGLTLHVFRANELWISLGLLAVLSRFSLEQEE